MQRLAGAPISWGICEVPNWGLQLSVERVLTEMEALGLQATELGAAGWLPGGADEINKILSEHHLRAVAAFVPLVLHDAAGDPRIAACAWSSETPGFKRPNTYTQ